MTNIVSIESIRKETFSVSPDELINTVVKKEDFVIIDGKIEPTRDLMLKLSTIAKTKAIDSELVNVTVKGNDTIYIFKSTVTLGNKTASAHGACSTAEIINKMKDPKKKISRLEHDAMATAETRAIKRAFEEAVGLPFINEIILKLFGGYETPKGEKKETPQITPEEFISKINGAKAMTHLKNIWIKYQANLRLYTPQERLAVETAKNKRKEELSHAGTTD